MGNELFEYFTRWVFLFFSNANFRYSTLKMLQPNSISFERIQSVDKDARQKYRREIEELRAKLSKTLKKYPSYNTDYSLLRWLRGYNYDIGENFNSFKAFAGNLKFFKIFQELSKKFLWIPVFNLNRNSSINFFLYSKKIRSFRKYS